MCPKCGEFGATVLGDKGICRHCGNVYPVPEEREKQVELVGSTCPKCGGEASAFFGGVCLQCSSHPLGGS